MMGFAGAKPPDACKLLTLKDVTATLGPGFALGPREALAEAKGMGLSVGFMSPTKQLSIKQTKALLDKAIRRLR